MVVSSFPGKFPFPTISTLFYLAYFPNVMYYVIIGNRLYTFSSFLSAVTGQSIGKDI